MMPTITSRTCATPSERHRRKRMLEEGLNRAQQPIELGRGGSGICQKARQR
jgi:hypothetical protein